MAQSAELVTTGVTIDASKAETKLKELKRQADDYRKALDKTTNAIDYKKIQKGLNDTKQDIVTMQSSLKNVEDVMRRLNKAASNELRRTLRTLNQELNKWSAIAAVTSPPRGWPGFVPASESDKGSNRRQQAI